MQKWIALFIINVDSAVQSVLPNDPSGPLFAYLQSSPGFLLLVTGLSTMTVGSQTTACLSHINALGQEADI